MKLLVATDQWFPDYRGGSARVAAETADRLAANGHDVTVIAPHVPGLPRSEQHGRRLLLRAIPRNWFPRTVLDGPAVYHAARRLGDDYDVLLSHHPATTVGLSAAHRGVPVVHVFHASPWREARLQRRRMPRGPRRAAVYPLEPMLYLLERKAVRAATRVFALSEYSRLLAARAGDPEAVRVVRAGVDTEAFSPGDGKIAARRRLELSPTARLVVAVRRLDAGLGLEQLVSSVARLSDERIRLALVGAGPRERDLRAQAAPLGDRVVFAGEADHPQLVDWYRAADLFVLSPAPHEGFGLATVEALACGTPAVGVAVGATPSVLEPLDERLVAAADDAASLAAAIEAGLELGASDAFRKRCRLYAGERFSWATALPTWEQELEQAAAKKTWIQNKVSCLH
jgi:glycosyltransferase involved in cell wall biosynthesis